MSATHVQWLRGKSIHVSLKWKWGSHLNHKIWSKGNNECDRLAPWLARQTLRNKLHLVSTSSRQAVGAKRQQRLVGLVSQSQDEGLPWRKGHRDRRIVSPSKSSPSPAQLEKACDGTKAVLRPRIPGWWSLKCARSQSCLLSQAVTPSCLRALAFLRAAGKPSGEAKPSPPSLALYTHSSLEPWRRRHPKSTGHKRQADSQISPGLLRHLLDKPTNSDDR